MDSNNWRVRRDPADNPRGEGQSARKPFFDQKPRSYNNSNSREWDPRTSSSRSQSSDLRKPLNRGNHELAIGQGRRLYVGNLPYEASVRDIEQLFSELSSEIEAINMSVDPMTGRNPSYCFIDFTSTNTAAKVVEQYNGRDFMRRPLKVRPGVKPDANGAKSKLRARDGLDKSPLTYDRWNSLGRPEITQAAPEDGRRLYVGGLPRFKDQEDSDFQIRAIFTEAGFQPQAISKLVWRNESKIGDTGNNNYCFVDMSTRQEATKAAAVLHGIERWGWTLTVNFARNQSSKIGERRRLYVSGLPAYPDQETTEKEMQKLFEGFKITSISKLNDPSEDKAQLPGNHHFCLVELEDDKEADRAIPKLDFSELWGSRIRVKLATRSGMSR